MHLRSASVLLNVDALLNICIYVYIYVIRLASRIAVLHDSSNRIICTDIAATRHKYNLHQCDENAKHVHMAIYLHFHIHDQSAKCVFRLDRQHKQITAMSQKIWNENSCTS